MFIQYNRNQEKHSLVQKKDIYHLILKSYFHMVIQIENVFVTKRNKCIHLMLLKCEDLHQAEYWLHAPGETLFYHSVINQEAREYFWYYSCYYYY